MEDGETIGALIPDEVEEWVKQRGCQILKVPKNEDVEARIRQLLGWGVENISSLEWADPDGELMETWLITGLDQDGLTQIFLQDQILDIQSLEKHSGGLPN